MHLGEKKLNHGTFWAALYAIYSDLEDTFRYVHPVADNLAVYSLRNYELLLRASTEFESVCKNEILSKGISTKGPNELNIKDFFMLEEYFKKSNPVKPGEAPIHQLASWKLGFYFDPVMYRQPLLEWKTTHALPWYQSYNGVKHNRQLEFRQASLENVLDAIGALFLLLMILDGVWCSTKWQGEKIMKPDGSLVYLDPNWPLCAKINYQDLQQMPASDKFIQQARDQHASEPWREKY